MIELLDFDRFQFNLKKKNGLLDKEGMLFIRKLEESLSIDLFKWTPLAETKWYRARKLKDRLSPFSSFEMEPPPPWFTQPSRIKSPCWFLANKIENAILESKPEERERVQVAEVTVASSINIIDLAGSSTLDLKRSKKRYGEIGEYHYMIVKEVQDLFCKGIDKPLDYAPTQAIGQYLKDKGYDGIRYISSQFRGRNKSPMNLALFHLKHAKVENPNICINNFSQHNKSYDAYVMTKNLNE